ncbi:hypothetical protein [Antrihabitans sp. YC2-6]|uniref:aa3-type cytochrome oxidase subunit CtaJ n=1 Tax=Antrihabitans sp. YC2-6 TaxID=2799498 RepID=UPI0018F2EE81|nr:hypothetical protein [Antrihabitans sp. YC2-6]MBJ8346765.1 hypothetical protein [Antrihabitans sp. YC2-6]
MSILETSLIYVGIPAVVTAIIASACFLLSRPIAGTHPAHFSLGDRWTREPVLWSATDEVTTHGHHGHSAGMAEDLIGGSAHGKW